MTCQRSGRPAAGQPPVSRPGSGRWPAHRRLLPGNEPCQTLFTVRTTSYSGHPSSGAVADGGHLDRVCQTALDPGAVAPFPAPPVTPISAISTFLHPSGAISVLLSRLSSHCSTFSAYHFSSSVPPLSVCSYSRSVMPFPFIIPAPFVQISLITGRRSSRSDPCSLLLSARLSIGGELSKHQGVLFDW